MVRDVILTYPDIKSYGWQKKLIEKFKEKHNITLDSSQISRYVKQIFEEWKSVERTIISKSQIMDHYMNLYGETTDVKYKILILRELCKLEGYLEAPEGQLNGPITLNFGDLKIPMANAGDKEKPTVIVQEKEKAS